MIVNTNVTSVMIIYSRQGNMQVDMSGDKKIELWIDNFSSSNYEDSEKYFLQMEVKEYFHLNNEIISKKNDYKYILTFEEEILNKCENAVLFEYGTKSHEQELYKFQEKTFSVSHICGSKYHTEGHKLRHEIFYYQNEINVPKNFFISQVNTNHHQGFIQCRELDNNFFNPVLGKSKYPMFDSMFSICVENTIKKYYFSEKLIDCLLCKSIPIYYGCSEIKNYFNIDGFIIFNNMDEFKSKIQTISPDYYFDRIDIIEENYNKALKWIDYQDRLIKKIQILSNL